MADWKQGAQVRHKPSAKDVALQAGVSQSTVSRVLNSVNTDMISEVTRRRVLEVARELGYSPNPFARALRGKKSYLLGVIVRDIADPFFARLIAGLSVEARLMGYQLVLGHAKEDPQEALEFTDILDARHTDGVFLLGDLKSDESALEEMARFTHALVALCRGPSPAFISTINTDNSVGTILALDHLRSLGHCRIGFIHGGWLGDMRERREAYLSYVAQHGLPFEPDWLQAETNNPAGGYRAISRLLVLQQRPTAVFVSDDVMALGVIKGATDAGWRIPADVSVVGFDNIDLANYLCPALTSVSQPVDEMAGKAMQLMLQMIDAADSGLPAQVLRLRPELVVRDSTGPVPAGTLS